MILKKIFSSGIISIFLSQHILCGTVPSIPIEDEDRERRPVRTRQSNHDTNEPTINETIIGASALIIAGYGAYRTYQAFQGNQEQETNDLSEISNDEMYADYHEINLSSYSTDSIEQYTQNKVRAESSSFVPQSRTQPYRSKIDLHDVRNDFYPYLCKKISKFQKLYHTSKIQSNKVIIITGTGKKRAGPNFRLKNEVKKILDSDEFFLKRISHYKDNNSDDGFISAFLRKNIC
jgi:hypothetical protein